MSNQYRYTQSNNRPMTDAQKRERRFVDNKPTPFRPMPLRESVRMAALDKARG
jgi:hypothetical protein